MNDNEPQIGEIKSVQMGATEMMRQNLALQLRELADRIAAGEDLLVHTYVHTQPWGPPQFGGAVTDEVFMGFSTVIHVGIANNAMLLERMRRDLSGQTFISDVQIRSVDADGNEHKRPAGDQPGND